MATERQILNKLEPELEREWLLHIHYPGGSMTPNRLLISSQGKIMTSTQPQSCGSFTLHDPLELSSLQGNDEYIFNEILGKILLVDHFCKQVMIPIKHSEYGCEIQVTLTISSVLCAK